MENKKKVYIFPLTTNKEKYNNYVPHFASALESQYEVVNKEQQLNIGMLDLIKYFRSNIFIFNWTENLLQLKGGLLQIFIYLPLTMLLKMAGKEIVWVFHNKSPHKGHTFFSRLLMKHNSNISNVVVTHSKEGIEFYKSIYKKDNIHFIPHPIYPEALPISKEKIYDIIIWGSIDRYKNVLDFLEYWVATSHSRNYKLLICGKCSDLEYESKLRNLLTSEITFINRYLTNEDLNEYISQSRSVLFTYDNKSILSSGALTYSVSFGNKIIGPASGSFRDYQELGLASTYKKFDEIVNFIDDRPPNKQKLDSYINDNRWSSFVLKLKALLNE